MFLVFRFRIGAGIEDSESEKHGVAEAWFFFYEFAGPDPVGLRSKEEFCVGRLSRRQCRRVSRDLHAPEQIAQPEFIYGQFERNQ